MSSLHPKDHKNNKKNQVSDYNKNMNHYTGGSTPISKTIMDASVDHCNADSIIAPSPLPPPLVLSTDLDTTALKFETEDTMEENNKNCCTTSPAIVATSSNTPPCSPSLEDSTINTNTSSMSTVSLQAHQELETQEQESHQEKDNEAEETWDLNKVMTEKELSKKKLLLCDTENCTLACACVYISNSGEKWHTCLDCQEMDFAGWPQSLAEIPLKHMSTKHKNLLIKKCSKNKAVSMPVFTEHCNSPLPKNQENDTLSNTISSPAPVTMNNALALPSNNTNVVVTPLPCCNTSNTSSFNSSETVTHKDDKQASTCDAEEEKWDLIKVLSIEELSGATVKCSTDECMLACACVYVSNSGEKWYSCLDCQQADYGGWPESLAEIPLTSMSDDHKAILVSKCSSKKKVAMPAFPNSACATPINDVQTCSHTSAMSLATGMKQQTNEVKPKKPSKNALMLHKKWQEAAESLGGPGTRIVVSKPAAKVVIFDFLFNSFAPMNITQIFKGLKGIVPSPVLKSCLEDMVHDKNIDENPFDVTSDAEDESSAAMKISKTKKDEDISDDPFVGTMKMKAGKSPNSTLYYIDYNKAKNGNGLAADERNNLLADVAKSTAEEQALKNKMDSVAATTKKLLSEPTNEEVAALLEQQENRLQKLQDEVEEASKHSVNEEDKLKLKKSITNMTAHWRNRRRLCMQFLIGMEEMSDGQISQKKCMSGDVSGLEIDADIPIAKAAVSFAKKRKHSSSTMLSSKKKQKTSNLPTGVLPSENFVAVLLDSQGCVKRVDTDYSF